MANEDDESKPKPEHLGTGMAQRAGSAAVKRKEQRKCVLEHGGMYDFAAGKCKDKQY